MTAGASAEVVFHLVPVVGNLVPGLDVSASGTAVLTPSDGQAEATLKFSGEATIRQLEDLPISPFLSWHLEFEGKGWLAEVNEIA